MKKIILMSAIFLSMNVFAASTNVNSNSSIANAIKNSSNNIPSKKIFPIVYGGKDISRPIVASADASLWIEQSQLIG